MSVYLQDGDLTLHHGDAASVLADLPEGSVDCVVTSPPYFGLRDYGTASWEGGDPACDHRKKNPEVDARTSTLGPNGTGLAVTNTAYQHGKAWRATCGKCGAVRHDVQIGLEPTPEEYVAALVGVFREVWRVLAPWGTCWVNIGDSYYSTTATQGRNEHKSAGEGLLHGRERNGNQVREMGSTSYRRTAQGLKPKDLLMMPARLALALQADGWWVRSRIVWSKPNPMPESVTDRPTSAHEDVYLLTKAPRYYYDAEAVREASERPEFLGEARRSGVDGLAGQRNDVGRHHAYCNPAGRNLRNVWSIATEPTPEAHFATFPTELVRRCLAAGCPERVCRECGEPSRRIVERDEFERGEARHPTGRADKPYGTVPGSNTRGVPLREVVGETWTDCGHDAWRPGIVLDPFMGSGTTALVARRLGLHAVGIDASAEYLAIAAKRLQQLSLLGGVA